MWRHVFKTSWRSLWKQKEFTVLNILGLSLGLATCLLITIYVKDELGFDRFNTKFERIFRVNTDVNYGGKATSFAVSPAPLAPTLVNDFSSVENAVRLAPAVNMRFKKGNTVMREDRVVYCDASIFDIFTLPFIEGSPPAALQAPHSVVITESAAKRYFGTPHSLGKVLYSLSDSTVYRVTGVIKDLPAQSHFHFDFFLSLKAIPSNYFDNHWGSLKDNTYVLLKRGADYKEIEAQLPHLVEENLGSDSYDALNQGGNYFRLSLTPLKNIHLYSNRQRELGPNGSIEYIYIFSSIAFLILLIACINFVNLSTARHTDHAFEVGLRKILGASRKHLSGRFLLESVLITFFAVIMATLLVWVLLPLFNQVADKDLKWTWDILMPLLPLLLIVPLGIGLLAGAYPALFLSSVNPIDGLRGKPLSSGVFSRPYSFRNILVVVQFAISTFLIVGTLVIHRQLEFIDHKNLGFNRSHILVINNVGGLNDPKLLKQQVKQLPGVVDATVSAFLPTDPNRYTNFVETKTGQPLQVQFWSVDADYLKTLQIAVADGRDFSPELPTDSAAIVVNQTAARMLGYSEGPLNKTLSVSLHGDEKMYHIIGVVRDFNFNSLRENVTPLVMVLGSNIMSSLSIRVHTGNLPHLIQQIKDTWKQTVPGQDFVYSFMDNDFDHMYRGERSMARIFLIFSVLAIIIASLGLVGLSTYVVERRAKEIGIRKVLGASVKSILGMLSKDFLKLIFIAIVIASPAAWWIMNTWLQDFAYRINIPWWIFALAALLSIVIALQAVGIKAIRAAVANPLKSIRTE